MKIKFSFNLKVFLLIFLLIIPFLCPNYITYKVHSIESLLMISRIAITIVMFLFILFDSKFKVNKGLFLILLFYICQFISAFINNTEIFSFLFNSIEILGLIFIIHYFLKRHSYETVLSFLCFYEIVIFINFITILIAPSEGLYTVTTYISNITFEEYKYWFLGIDNLHILYYFPAIIFSFIYSFYNKNKLSFRTIFLIIIIAISAIISWSATTLVFLTGLLIYVIFRKKIEKSNIINGLTLLLGGIITNIGIVIVRVQEWFRYIIVDILKKDLTFTNRTYIWDDTLKYILNKPLLGYGQESELIRYKKGINFNAFHAHNLLLEILYTGGIIAFSLFIFNLVYIIMTLKNKENKEISKLLIYFMFIYLIVSLTEVYSLFTIFLIVILVSNFENIISDIKFRKERKKNGDVSFSNCTGI